MVNFCGLSLPKLRAGRHDRKVNVYTAASELNSLFGGANLVRTMPSTALSYSSIVGVRPRMVESNDSPFFSVESFTTRLWKSRVEVAGTW